jgi:hypothetical protein
VVEAFAQAEFDAPRLFVYHTVSAPFTRSFEEAAELLDRLVKPPRVEAPALIDEVAALRLQWGVSDGN